MKGEGRVEGCAGEAWGYGPSGARRAALLSPPAAVPPPPAFSLPLAAVTAHLPPASPRAALIETMKDCISHCQVSPGRWDYHRLAGVVAAQQLAEALAAADPALPATEDKLQVGCRERLGAGGQQFEYAIMKL